MVLAEGVGFEPTTPLSQGKRLAGARTRPLCDPSTFSETLLFYGMESLFTTPTTGDALTPHSLPSRDSLTPGEACYI